MNAPAAHRLLPILSLLAGLVAFSCGPPTLPPVYEPDPGIACPGRWTAWSLEILDRRADREGSEKLVALLGDSVRKSFPGCTWSEAGTADRPVISIEIHRFAAPFHDEMFNAAAEWTVSVRGPGGQTLTEFEAEATVERPNYRGSNNEKEALRQVFGDAFRRTVAGLRSVSGGG
jgi:hypothetical protein